MARALVIKFKRVRAANETRGIIDGLNIVMEASVSTSNEVKREQNSDEIKDWIDDSNEARNKQHQEKVLIYTAMLNCAFVFSLSLLFYPQHSFFPRPS